MFAFNKHHVYHLLMNSYVGKAISLAGGAKALATLLSDEMRLSRPLSSMAVRQWLSRGVPAEYCIPIERVLSGKVLRSDLRPDLYPPDEYHFIKTLSAACDSEEEPAASKTNYG